MPVSDLRGLNLFDGLTDEQLNELFAAGEEISFPVGQELFRHGEPADSWWVLISGAIELTRRGGREDTTVGQLAVPGRWAGGFRAWDEHAVYLATGRGVVTGTVFRVAAAELRRLTTGWFPFGAHLIEGLFGTARSIESTARQRDALVTLGTLAAGLAHEINNPAAAAVRAVQALQATCDTLLSSLGQLAAGEITAAQFRELDRLRLDVVPLPTPVDPLELSDRQEAVASWLTDHGVANSWTIGATLAAAGVDTVWCERAAAAIAEDALAAAVGWVSSTFGATALLSEVGGSTRRISELVSAVRSYSQLDRASVQRTDVVEGLESTLVMLGHKLRGGITVARDYASDMPEIDAFAGELNQVWTNLIDNAIDAMDGHGTLRLTTRRDGDSVVVEVGDSGHGMTPAVAARAFEAFYTTKDVGKGTGLGLDIARRIVVERHHGTIGIQSEPGDTVIRVRLPLTPPAER